MPSDLGGAARAFATYTGEAAVPARAPEYDTYYDPPVGAEEPRNYEQYQERRLPSEPEPHVGEWFFQSREEAAKALLRRTHHSSGSKHFAAGGITVHVNDLSLDGQVAKRLPPQLKMEVMRRGSLPSCSSNDRRTRAFFEAISEGDSERVERILSMDFDVNTTDDAGCTPLHFAAEGEVGLVATLLEHGANVDAANHAGETPLMKAIAFDDADTVRLLMEAGASVDKTDRAGRDVQMYVRACKSSIIHGLVREERKSREYE